MRIEDINSESLKKLGDKDLKELKFRIGQVWRKHFKRHRTKRAVSSQGNVLHRITILDNYILLKEEMKKRGLECKDSSLDKSIFKKALYGFDIQSLDKEIILDREVVCLIGPIVKSPKRREGNLVFNSESPSPNLKTLTESIFGEEKEASKKLSIGERYIPLYDLILRRKDQVKRFEFKKDDFSISILGGKAELNPSSGEHFCLLLSKGESHVLVDPSVPKKKVPVEPTHVIVTQPEKDHWANLDDWKELPVYSSGAVLNKLPKDNQHPFLKHLKPDGFEILPIKTVHKVGTPSIGIRVDVGSTQISILPEFLQLGKAQKDLIKKTIWIVGCGDWEEDDEEAGKLSFKSLMALAEELDPEKIYLTNIRKSLLSKKSEIEKGLKDWKGRILLEGDELSLAELKKAGWGLNKPGYRLFEIGDLKNTKGMHSGKGIVECKWDGVRTRVDVENGDAKITTDPEETETPNKTKRLPWQVKELEAMEKEDFIGDAELVMYKKGENECLHRTAVNALINGKFDPKEPSKQAHLYIFDIIQFKDKSTKSWPLKERKELLSRFKDTEHVHFVQTTTSLKKDSLSYIVDLGNESEVKKAVDKIMHFAHENGAFPKHISEGAMIKRLDAPYGEGAVESMAKWKEKFEIDCLVVGKHEIVREGKKTGNFNYEIAIGPISEVWAQDIKKKEKKAAVEYGGKWYNYLGKTDNTDTKLEKGEILRVAAEDVNRYKTESEDHPYFQTYIAVVMQPVPEKEHPDKMQVAERLSKLTPERADIAKSVKDDSEEAKEKGEMPSKMYKNYAEKKQPLPEEFYVDYDEGDAWMQTHIRGLENDEVSKYKKGDLNLSTLFEGHSIHLDIRIDFGKKKLVQWVVTDNQVGDYFKMLQGKSVPTKGPENVAKSFALVKPSAEEPERKPKRARKIEKGIYLVEPHGKMIAEGEKKLIVKIKKLPDAYVDKEVYLCSGDKVYGLIKLDKPEGISQEEFERLKDKHRITDEEAEDWNFSTKRKLLSYGFEMTQLFKPPLKFKYPRGAQTVIRHVDIEKTEEKEEPSITKEGADQLAEYQIKDKSYFIPPGEVGSSAYKWAWMGLIWTGKVKAGMQRKDYHEYFFYPDKTLPEKNEKLLDGAFSVKCFERGKGKGNYWQIWMKTDGMPADPIKHKDGGHYGLTPADEMKAIGRDHYEYGEKEPQ